METINILFVLFAVIFIIIVIRYFVTKKPIPPSDGKIACIQCGAKILSNVAEKNRGLCFACYNNDLNRKLQNLTNKEKERNISQNDVNEPIGYFDCPINNPAVCSDKSCPCGPVSIPYGSGYLYVSQSAVDFRKDARSDAELKVKRAEYIKSLQLGEKARVWLEPEIHTAIIMCEDAAKRRRLDLKVAAADAKFAWETGQAPLRPTPINKVQESVNERNETDINLIRDIHFFIEIPGIDDNTNPNDITINVPKAFIDFADKELKLSGKLNLFVEENIDKIKLTKLKKLENFEDVKNNFYSKYAESTNWETYYRSTEAGYRFSILVQYNFAKSSWVQDFIDKTLSDPTFQENSEYQKKTTNEDNSTENASTLVQLGINYLIGQEVSQDFKEAQKYFRLAANMGNADAQFCLGNIYDKGYGVPKDYKEAIRWYRLAADQGHIVAQFCVGVFYRDGFGVPQDYGEAVKWTQLSAQQGYDEAQYNLGIMYYNGLGVSKDLQESVMWLQRAADQGNVNAMKRLGVNE